MTLSQRLKTRVTWSGGITSVDITLGRWTLTLGCPSRFVALLWWRPQTAIGYGGSRYSRWSTIGVGRFAISAYRDGRHPRQ